MSVSTFFILAGTLSCAVGLLLLWIYASPAVFSRAGWAVALFSLGTLVFLAWKGGGGPDDLVAPRALLAVLTVVAIVYAVSSSAASSAVGNVFTSYFGLVLGALAIVVLLAVGWLKFGSELTVLQQQPGMVGLLAQLMFALPCYFAWIAQFFVNDYRNTAPATILLLATEFVLLALYLFRKRIETAVDAVVARVTDSTRGYTVTPLQTERVFLNYVTVLGNRPLPEGVTDTRVVDPNTGDAGVDAANKTHTMLTPAQSLGKNQDFRISFELYLHPLEIGTDSPAFSILRYADGGGSLRGCPSVFFGGAGEPSVAAVANLRNSPQLKVYLTNAAAEESQARPVLLAVPLQKWIRLVFYYTRSRVDVFLDDQLVHSLVWTPENRPTFGPSDKFILGSPMPNGGALGSLRNLNVATPKEEDAR